MSFLLNKEEKIGRAYKCTAFAEEQINYCHTKFFVQQINTTAQWLTNKGKAANQGKSVGDVGM